MILQIHCNLRLVRQWGIRSDWNPDIMSRTPVYCIALPGCCCASCNSLVSCRKCRMCWWTKYMSDRFLIIQLLRVTSRLHINLSCHRFTYTSCIPSHHISVVSFYALGIMQVETDFLLALLKSQASAHPHLKLVNDCFLCIHLQPW